MNAYFIAVVSSLVAVVALVEIIIAGWANSSWNHVVSRANKSWRVDIMFFIIHLTGIMGTLGFIYTVGGAHLIQAASQEARSYLGGHGAITGVAAVAVFYVVHSFGEYWSHRIFHNIRLWNIHRLHHSAETMNPLVMHRANPANFIS